MRYRLSENSTEHYQRIFDYFKMSSSRIGDVTNRLFLKEMFEKLPRNSSSRQIVGDLACLVLEFLNEIKPF